MNCCHVTDANKHPRALLGSGGSSLKFRRVSQSDVLVVQCNASNTHGYIFDNAFLNVLGSYRNLNILLLNCICRLWYLTMRGFCQGF